LKKFQSVQQERQGYYSIQETENWMCSITIMN
jgi:hypothetical protein